MMAQPYLGARFPPRADSTEHIAAADANQVPAILRRTSEPVWFTVTPQRAHDIVRTLRADPASAMAVFVLQGTRMRDTPGLMDEFAASMQFFDGFGRNYYALSECIEYIDETFPGYGAYLLVIHDADQVLADKPDCIDALATSLAEAHGFLASAITDNGIYNRGPLGFHVVLATAHPNRIAEWPIRALPHPRVLDTAPRDAENADALQPSGPPAAGLSTEPGIRTQRDWLFEAAPPRLRLGPPEPEAERWITRAFYSHPGIDTLTVELRTSLCLTFADAARQLSATLQLADPSTTTPATLSRTLARLPDQWPLAQAVIVLIPHAELLLDHEPDRLPDLLTVIDGVQFDTTAPPALHVLLHTTDPTGQERLKDAARHAGVMLGTT